MTTLNCKLESFSIVPEIWDGKTYSFDFICIPKEKIGKPDEKSFIKVYQIIIRISGTLIAIWDLSDNDLAKILYWYAHRAIYEKPLEMKQIIELHSRNTGACPCDPKAIKFPNPDLFNVEIKKKIGF